MRHAALVLALLALPAPLWAQTAPGGCDKPGISLAREAAMMSVAHQAASGGEMTRAAGAAIDMPLKPFASAGLPVPPERPPKPETSAGAIAFAAGAAGTFRVSVTVPAWIDVVQNGRYLEPIGVDGVGDCAGLTKSLKVALGAGAFVLQFSNSERDSLVVTVAPAE